MDIFYIHGFGSRYNPDSDKIRGLGRLGAVRGADYDYTATFDSIIAHLTRETQRADLLVGTSLGGYLAMRLGTLTCRPYIAINPAIDPATSLRAYLGPGTDHYGTDFVMEEATLRSYPPLLPGLAPERGLVLIDEGDEVIDVPAAIEMFHVVGCWSSSCRHIVCVSSSTSGPSTVATYSSETDLGCCPRCCASSASRWRKISSSQIVDQNSMACSADCSGSDRIASNVSWYSASMYGWMLP